MSKTTHNISLAYSQNFKYVWTNHLLCTDHVEFGLQLLTSCLVWVNLQQSGERRRKVAPAEHYSSGGGKHSDQLNPNISLTAGPVRLSFGCSSCYYKHTFLLLTRCKLRTADVTLTRTHTAEREAVPVFATTFNRWHRIHYPSGQLLKGKVMPETFNIFLGLFFHQSLWELQLRGAIFCFRPHRL